MKSSKELYYEAIKRVDAVLNGGSGSGNWGHSGREGKVGGSGKGRSGRPGIDYKKSGQSFDSFARTYVANNYDKAIKVYKRRVLRNYDTNAPNIVSADDAKFVVPGFKPERSTDYHEGSSTLAKKYYVELLADKTTLDKPVMFTAGGTGAGKSTTLRGKTKAFSEFAAVYDGNMANAPSGIKKIDAALTTGRDVQIKFVARDPVIAFKYGVIPRIKKEGRLINISTHIGTHLDSAEAVTEIANKYKGDKRVSIDVFDNSYAIGKAKKVPIDFLSKTGYNKDVGNKD